MPAASFTRPAAAAPFQRRTGPDISRITSHLRRQAHRHAELVLAFVQIDSVDLRDERQQRQRRELLLETGEELAVRVHLALDGGGLVELVQASEGEVGLALGGGLLDLRAHLHLRRYLMVVGAREDAARFIHLLGHFGGYREVRLHVLARGGVLGQGRLDRVVAALRAQRHAREGARCARGEVALVKFVARLAVERAILVVELGQAGREQARFARCGRLALHLGRETLGDIVSRLKCTLEHATSFQRDLRVHAVAEDVLGGQVAVELGVVLCGLGGEHNAIGSLRLELDLALAKDVRAARPVLGQEVRARLADVLECNGL
mmetsp:Transcript_17627/g.35834  ORF Transcript_17627/g.35834 Transcript_17627/m.35834 type:complete len:320 (+) Transcript_17627:187-1146(+)